MHTAYRHTQIARPFQVILGLFAAASVGAALFGPLPVKVVFSVVAIGLALASAMTRLTTCVDAETFTHEFGLGVWRKRIPLARIEAVRPVRNAWWYGFGIRLTPHGWLYNVWGLDAVEIRLRNGRTFRVGTDEPDALARAITNGAERAR